MPLLAAAAAAAAIAGCGSETTFSADEAVAEINRHGGELELGEHLTTSAEGAEVHAVSFADSGAAEHEGEGEHSHFAGTLVITDDDEEALAEFQRCEAAASLVCFRAANALVVFDDTTDAEDLQQLADAVRGLGEE